MCEDISVSHTSYLNTYKIYLYSVYSLKNLSLISSKQQGTNTIQKDKIEKLHHSTGRQHGIIAKKTQLMSIQPIRLL